jgi:DNA-binding GntR family transcriptional regulator
MLSARDPKTPAYRWIYGALRTEILEGRLRPGSRLPSSRDLALQYRLSRGTIVTAFEQLKSEGYIEGTIGSGSYVSKVVPEQLLQVSSARVATPSASQARQRSTGSDPSALASRAARRESREYRGAAASQTYRSACISLENIPGSYRILR